MTKYVVKYHTECSWCKHKQARSEKFKNFDDADYRVDEMIGDAITSDAVCFAEIRLFENNSLLMTWVVDGETLLQLQQVEAA